MNNTFATKTYDLTCLPRSIPDRETCYLSTAIAPRTWPALEYDLMTSHSQGRYVAPMCRVVAISYWCLPTVDLQQPLQCKDPLTSIITPGPSIVQYILGPTCVLASWTYMGLAFCLCLVINVFSVALQTLLPTSVQPAVQRKPEIYSDRVHVCMLCTRRIEFRVFCRV